MLIIILDFIVLIIFLVPSIAGFFWPKETFLFGNRWRYNEEPKISDLQIFVIKISSVIILVVIFLIIFFSLLRWLL